MHCMEQVGMESKIKIKIRSSVYESDVWFEDRWMVSSWCDE
jgi:hypothetical protein